VWVNPADVEMRGRSQTQDPISSNTLDRLSPESEATMASRAKGQEVGHLGGGGEQQVVVV
jgi:hypothetical protein